MNSRPAYGQPGWYYSLSSFFRTRFGKPVYKIPIDAGFSCPNRDGTIGFQGCSYCYNPSFSPFIDRGQGVPVAAQIERGKKRTRPSRYLAYFQSYTNTYAPPEKLKNLYDEALSDPEVIGISIATRPDCISEEIIALLEGYAKSCHLWIEYGLQSAHDSTLKKINRGHDSKSFTDAVALARNRGIYICAHIILGLPGETTKMMLETIDFLNTTGVDGVKFHHLQVIKNTTLADQYARKLFKVYKKAEDYIPVLCDCLEQLSPGIVVHRLASQATSKELLIVPHWPESAGQIAASVEAELIKRGTCQGYKERGMPFSHET